MGSSTPPARPYRTRQPCSSHVRRENDGWGSKAIDSVLTLPLVSFGFFLKLLPVSEAWCHSNQIQTNHKRDHNSNNALCHRMCQSMPKALLGSISSNFQSNVGKEVLLLLLTDVEIEAQKDRTICPCRISSMSGKRVQIPYVSLEFIVSPRITFPFQKIYSSAFSHLCLLPGNHENHSRESTKSTLNAQCECNTAVQDVFHITG